MLKKLSCIFAAVLFSITAIAQTQVPVSKNLEIVGITPNVLMHVSYMDTESFGRVACNGLIYITGREAVVMDTPHDDATSQELLDWFKVTYPNVAIRAVIINHFHNDCLGGLKEFHNRGIKSYANALTAELAEREGATVPYNTFAGELKMKLNGRRIVARYFGEGHTADNIVTWLPDEGVLFGGCMIKADGAGKGNLADANVQAWAHTVAAIKDELGKRAKVIVPGHGAYGGVELLDYTIQLFDGGAN